MSIPQQCRRALVGAEEVCEYEPHPTLGEPYIDGESLRSKCFLKILMKNDQISALACQFSYRSKDNVC